MITFQYTAGLFALLFAAAGTGLDAQNDPYFDMVLYFEDAVGNRDSVSFGYDLNASSNLDAEWGEAEITAPFNSVFEVRIAEPTINDELLSKRIISRTFPFVGSPCLDGGIGFIYIHAIHQPVKVWWDRMPLAMNECFVSGWIIDNIEHHLATLLWEYTPNYYCLGAVDSAYFNLPDTQGQFDPPRIFIEKEVEGFGMKQIPGLEIAIMPSGAFSTCYWVQVGTNDRIGITGEISAFPNPVHNQIYLQLDEKQVAEELRLFNVHGQYAGALSRNSLQYQSADVSYLASGTYFFQVKTQDDKYYIGKFVKQ